MTTFYLIGSRILLTAIPLAVLERRLVEESFTSDILVGDRPLPVTFTPDWPGDAYLATLPAVIRQRRADESPAPLAAVIVERATSRAVGVIAFGSVADDTGSVEVDFAIVPATRGRGYATDAVRALVGWAFAFAKPHVNRVVAVTRPDNLAGMRVLEKARFARVGQRDDDRHGALIVWEHVRPLKAFRPDDP